jgi:alanine-synthesizing transaminase
MFPRIDLDRHRFENDEKFVLDFLRQEKILLVQGSAFHWDAPDHLRIVFLPRVDDLGHAIERLGNFLERYTG